MPIRGIQKQPQILHLVQNDTLMIMSELFLTGRLWSDVANPEIKAADHASSYIFANILCGRLKWSDFWRRISCKCFVENRKCL
jgi:hypothetical protein